MSLQLRPYQRRMIDQAVAKLRYETASLILQGATGSGKTVVGAALLKEFVFGQRPNAKVGWLTPGRRLRTQAIEAFEALDIPYLDWTSTPPVERDWAARSGRLLRSRHDAAKWPRGTWLWPMSATGLDHGRGQQSCCAGLSALA